MKLLALFLTFNFFIPQQAFAAAKEVFVEQGIYRPFFREKDESDKTVGPLYVDREPVTNAEFKKFLRLHPEWNPDKIPEVFSSSNYLKGWRGDSYSKAQLELPVTNVSWFAARRYCESHGKRLLTTDEWEYVAEGQKDENIEMILQWYSKTGEQLASVRNAKPNRFGIKGLHGYIWEWVEDYSSSIIVGDSRNSNETSASLFCGAGALQAKDPSQYATFMRFAFRSSLKANYSTAILGFRCARDAQ